MSISVQCNLSGFVPGRTGGAQVFLEGLLPEIQSFEELDLTVHGSDATLQWLHGLPGSSIKFNEVGASTHRIDKRIWAMRRVKSACKSGDVIWSPLNQGIGEFGDVKEVVTIHDLIPLHYSQANTAYPADLKRRLMFWIRWKNSMRIARRASAIMAVSQSCVEPLKQALGSDTPPVFGAPNGIDPSKQAAAQHKRWEYTGKPSVLAITSGSMPHKGIKTLEAVAERMPDFEFRLIGRRSLQVQPLSNVVFTGRVDDAQLADEFRQASALFFPSRIEGFGLPVLEALVFGTPVIATDIPVLREVGGKHSKYFKIDNIESAVSQLQTTIGNRDASESMSKNGLVHAEQFTWRAAAEKYLDVFRLTATSHV